MEVVWGLIKPNIITGKITKIIACCFYSPPRSRKKTDLIEHLTLNLQSFLNTYPNAGIIISGDRNDLSISRLLSVDSSLRQIVTKGTRGPDNILDVILTNLDAYLEEPVIVPPIDVDDPTKGGVPSDHNGVVVNKKTDASRPVYKQKFKRIIRPITASALNKLGQVFTGEEWKFLDPSLPPSSLVDIFEYYSGNILDTFCPQKVIFSRPNETPWITEDLKVLKRKIMREYERKGKSLNYHNLKSSYDTKLQNEAQKYRSKLENEILSGDRNSCYAALRKLGARPGSENMNTFTLPTHADENYTALESVEIIANHFAVISQEYTALDVTNFPPKMRADLNNPNMAKVPNLEEYEVYRKICKSKKPNSSVPGDLPKRVVAEFSCELSVPMTIIFNSILKTKEYPRQWVVEYQTPIPKSHPPSSEEELRNIAKTTFFSKVFESFLSEWLLPLVEPYLDPCQYGLK